MERGEIRYVFGFGREGQEAVCPEEKKGESQVNDNCRDTGCWGELRSAVLACFSYGTVREPLCSRYSLLTYWTDDRRNLGPCRLLPTFLASLHSILFRVTGRLPVPGGQESKSSSPAEAEFSELEASPPAPAHEDTQKVRSILGVKWA